ncbi:MAG: PAS domain S-box protein, partial [Bacteroidota bacterium]
MAHPPPSDSSPPSLGRWYPASLSGAPALVVRQARAVLALSGLTLFSYIGVAVAFWLGGLESQAIAAAATAVAALLAVLLVRVGQIQPAAFLVSLTLAVAPIVQASLDAGVRDPALALAVLAPLAAAMVLDTRTAVATVGVVAIGVGALLILDLMDMVLPSASTSDTVAGYTVLAVLSGAAFSVLAGALYERHTREVIDAAELRAGRLGEALQESEERYRTLVNEVPIGIYRTAPDGSVLLSNQHLAKMLGLESPDEVLALNSGTFYDELGAQSRLREALDQQGSVRRYPARWKTPSGNILSVRVDAHAVRDDDGDVAYYEGVVEDVTAEVLAQAAVQKSEARFRALVQRSSDVTVILDREGRLTYVSPSAQSLLGYEVADLEGRAMVDFIHPNEREPMMKKLVQPASEVISSPPVEVRLLHAEGHYLYAEGVGTSLFEDSAVQGFVVNLRDVTERHRARGALIHAKRQAEELSQLKSTFLSNMSHEIRTPLTAILGFTDVLRDEVTDEGASEFVGLIAENGHRLLEMLNAILDLARMDAGKGHFVPE